MLRLVNDEKVISESTIRKIEEKIKEIGKFLEKRPQFFALAKSVDESRKYNSDLIDKETIIYLVQHKRVPWSKVISNYENSRIYYNPKIYRNADFADLVSNIVHETGHHYNLRHDFKWNKTRKYSSPYYMGYLYEFLTRRYDAFNYKDETDLADLVTKWRNHINNVIK